MSDPPREDEEPSASGVETTGETETSDDEGPGCLPAVLAASVLLGIFSLVICAGGTWFIYQNRDQLALRSVRGAFVPAVEQSLLEPEEKAATVELLNDFGDELERGQIESWQASGVMQRITRLPIIEWGQLRAVDAFVRSHSEFSEDDAIQFHRLRKGVERGDLTTIDFQHILSPVTQPDQSPSGRSLTDPLEVEAIRQVIEQARLVADRAEISKEPQTDVTIDTIVRRQIDAGLEQGSY